MAIISHCKICNKTCVKRHDGTCGGDGCIVESLQAQLKREREWLDSLLKAATDVLPHPSYGDMNTDTLADLIAAIHSEREGSK